MLGLFKRNAQQHPYHDEQPVTPVAAADEPVSQDDAARLQRSAIKRELQLRLHAHRVFPSAIRVLSEDGWAEVHFSPTHPRSVDAPARLHDLHRRGMLVVDGLGHERPDATWVVRLRVGTGSDLVTPGYAPAG